MKNLEKFGSQELTLDEMKEINGGAVCLGWCIVGAIVLAGAIGTAAGYAAGYVVDALD